MFYNPPRTKPTTKFGEWLDQQMRLANVSVRDVASELHCGSITVSYHRSGRRRPTFSDVIAYCWVFKCDDDPETVWNMINVLIEI